MENKENIAEILKPLELDFTQEQISRFYDYYLFLTEKNKVMNLTAITDFTDVVRKHFMDSLMISRYLDLHQTTTVIDVGTGAGFPGIPLKIAFPHLKICLMDSLEKRIRFLKEAVTRLDLQNVEEIHSRAEDLAHHDRYREKYDLCVSRAVSRLSVLSEYCIPFVRRNGLFVSYKSGNIIDEVGEAEYAVKQLGGKIKDIHEFHIPGTDIARSLVFIEKKTCTNKCYPRKAGIPQKVPLIMK